MKNVFFALAFMLVGTFAFASTGEVTKLNENSPIEIVELKTAKTSEKAEDGWACCTVTRNGGSATVCRADGNAGRACRQARRLTRAQ
ncbi:hypothetical protein [uncultured Winogradskyella sp.]|uniref:hypothetical protein n=1 Tax=uncultured Winogradskyella sp. TaxID=395353 RepID=UPI0030EC1A17|tara:strand:+ start:209 stop:469 length:261 start_codon:yes stop_codon:yes gene_type:complete